MPFYFTGMMISQLLIGYFSTRHGLKSALKASVFIATLGTLFIALAPNFIYLLLSFLIQAFGVGAIDPISSNMTNVAFDKLRAHKVFVFTTLAYGVAAVMAPFSVTIFRSVLPVRSIYLILAILAAIYLLLLLAPLKAITEKRENSSFKSYLKKNFFLLTCFNHKNFGFFPSISLFFSLFMAAFFSLFTVVPFILANQFHRDLAHVVELFAVGCFFYFGGMLLSQSLSLYFKATTIIRFSLYLTLINVASLLLRSIVDLYGIWEVNVFFYFLTHFFLINLTLGILTPCNVSGVNHHFSFRSSFFSQIHSCIFKGCWIKIVTFHPYSKKPMTLFLLRAWYNSGKHPPIRRH